MEFKFIPLTKPSYKKGTGKRISLKLRLFALWDCNSLGKVFLTAREMFLSPEGETYRKWKSGCIHFRSGHCFLGVT